MDLPRNPLQDTPLPSYDEVLDHILDYIDGTMWESAETVARISGLEIKEGPRGPHPACPKAFRLGWAVTNLIMDKLRGSGRQPCRSQDVAEGVYLEGPPGAVFTGLSAELPEIPWITPRDARLWNRFTSERSALWPSVDSLRMVGGPIGLLGWFCMGSLQALYTGLAETFVVNLLDDAWEEADFWRSEEGREFWEERGDRLLPAVARSGIRGEAAES